MVVSSLEPGLPVRLVFSALPSTVAREVEPRFAQADYAVCSNASSYRIFSKSWGESRSDLLSDPMAVSKTALRCPCPKILRRYLSVVHNTLRGAASGSVLNAELLVAEGYIK